VTFKIKENEKSFITRKELYEVTKVKTSMAYHMGVFDRK
jgi:hypothetical protein